MAGFADILSALGIGGNQPPAPNVTQNQSMPMPAAPTGIEGALSNPLLQGALATYLGTIGSPRHGGLGRALASGGLGGLQTFNQAEQLKQKLPLEAAQTAEALGTAGLRAAQTRKLQPNPQVGAHFQTLANDPGTPAAARQIYGMLADGVSDGSINAGDAAKVASTEDINGARSLLLQAQTNLANANASLVPMKGQALQSEVGKNQAEAGLAGAKTGEVPGEEAKTAAETALASGRSAQLSGEAARTAAQTAEAQAAAEATPARVAQGAEKLGLTQQAQLQKEAEAAYAARPLAVKAKDALTIGGDPHGDFVKNYIAMHSVPAGTPHVSASGKPIVMGPDGHYHYVNP